MLLFGLTTAFLFAMIQRGPPCRSARLVRDARPYRQSARTVLKISQTDRQPPGGMPPTCDSMDKGPGAFFARQTIENEANFVPPEEH